MNDYVVGYCVYIDLGSADNNLDEQLSHGIGGALECLVYFVPFVDIVG